MNCRHVNESRVREAIIAAREMNSPRVVLNLPTESVDCWLEPVRSYLFKTGLSADFEVKVAGRCVYLIRKR